ncbi:MAG: hypothetical protein KF836_07725 [Fimbriimonadaceae bacterium]|nr:hypothetical protein [Fimbriimonadaceae bacterium]
MTSLNEWLNQDFPDDEMLYGRYEPDEVIGDKIKARAIKRDESFSRSSLIQPAKVRTERDTIITEISCKKVYEARLILEDERCITLEPKHIAKGKSDIAHSDVGSHENGVRLERHRYDESNHLPKYKAFLSNNMRIIPAEELVPDTESTNSTG